MTALPPTDREAEQAIIGATFHDNSLAVTLEIEPEDFSDTMHQKLWAIAQAQVGRGGSFTRGQIVAQDPRLESYVQSIADRWGGLTDPAKHVSAVKDCAGRRHLQGLMAYLADEVIDREKPLEELTAQLIAEASKLAVGRQAKSKRAVAMEIAESLSQPMPCYQTGLAMLDHVIGGGLFAGKAYGIAARKKVGKTVMLGTISHNLNRAGVPHLFIAAEMSDTEIEQRNMARELGINSVRFLKADRSMLRSRVAEYAANVPDCMFYERAPGASLEEVKRMVSRAVIHKGIKGVILDYWQLIGGKAKGETEEYHLRNVAQWLADVCRRHGIWCLIAAQVNQDGNTRGGEGLKLAVDVYFTLHREKDSDQAWLEMEESRYVLYANVGSADFPGLILNKHGPFFEDAGSPAEAPQIRDYTESAA